MEDSCILSYELPNIRCVNCNKPIAHLFEKYKHLLSMQVPAVEVYEILGLKRVCCRKEIGYAKIITITKSNEYKILGIDGPESRPLIPEVKSKLKPIVQKSSKKIESVHKPCIPISICIGSKTTKLNDDLWVSYVNESIYLAQ